MVSKNNRTKKMEAVANRQPHFGIRKLTIGAASVLLGTTLWMGTTASTSHADTVDDGDNGVESHQESHTQANNGASSAKSVVVVKNDNSAANQSQASSISDDSSQTSSSSVASSQSAQSSTQSSTASESGQTDASSKSSSVDTSSLETNKAKGAAVVAQNKDNKVASSSSAAQKQSAQTSQKAQSNAATNKAATSSSSNASSAKKAAETLARDAAANTAKQAINNNAVSSAESSITTAGNTGKTNQGGNNVLSFNLDKAALKGLTLTGSQNLNKLFGVSLAASPASGNAGNSSQNSGDQYANLKTASDWADVTNAAQSGAAGIKISGAMEATSDLNIGSGKDFAIVGENNASLSLGSNAINNSGNLTLKDLTINGSILGSGKVNVEGTVVSNVDDTNSSKMSVSQYNSQHATGDRNQWYNSNITGSGVTVENGASLTINRSKIGDGINLQDGSTVRVGDKATLNVNLTSSSTDITRYHNAGVFMQKSGNFISGYKSVVNFNTGIGQAIAIGADRPLTTDANRFGGYGARSRENGPTLVQLGKYSKFNFTGRDGIVLGNNANFISGEYSTVRFNNHGKGTALDLANHSNIEISKHSDTLFRSEGKTGVSGSYDGGNYIGVNEGGNITIDEYATFRVILTGRGSDPWDDVISLDSEDPNTHAAFTSKKGAVVDIRDDNSDFYAELISFPLGDSYSTIDIEDPLLFNLQRYSSNGPITGWTEGAVAGTIKNNHIRDTNRYMPNLIYMGGATVGKHVLKIGGTDYVVFQSIRDMENATNLKNEMWLNVNSIAFSKSGFQNFNYDRSTGKYTSKLEGATDNGANPDISISGSDLVSGIPANHVFEGNNTEPEKGNPPYYGISTMRAAQQIWISHNTPLEIAGTHKNVIKYYREEIDSKTGKIKTDPNTGAPVLTPVLDSNGNPLVKEQDLDITRDLQLSLDEATLKKVRDYATTHNADEILTYLRDNYVITKDTGWQYTDANGNKVTNPYAKVDSPTFDGYTATVKSTNAPGVTVGADGSVVKANFTMPTQDAVVQNGKLTDAYKNNGTTGIPADYVTTIVYAPTPAKKGTVNVIFHDTTNNTDISGYGPKSPLTGAEGTNVTGYDPATDITTLENKGYIRDTASPVPTGDLTKMPTTYTDGTQTVYINMKHGVVPVNPTNPGKPGQSINPNDPNSHKYPADSDKVTATVTRTINYVDQNGNPVNGSPDGKSTVTQTVTFTRSGYLDKVTGQWVTVDKDNNVTGTASEPVWSENDSHNFNEVDSKATVTENGKTLDVQSATSTTPDQITTDGNSAKATTVHHDTRNIVVKVTYGPQKTTPIPYQTVIKYDPSLDQNTIVLHQQGKNGSKDSTGKVLTPAQNEIIYIGKQTATIDYWDQGGDYGNDVNSEARQVLENTITASPVETDNNGNVRFDENGNVIAATINYDNTSDKGTNYQTDLNNAINDVYQLHKNEVNRDQVGVVQTENGGVLDDWYNAERAGTNKYNIKGLNRTTIQTLAEKAGQGKVVDLANEGPHYLVWIGCKNWLTKQGQLTVNFLDQDNNNKAILDPDKSLTMNLTYQRNGQHTIYHVVTVFRNGQKIDLIPGQWNETTGIFTYGDVDLTNYNKQLSDEGYEFVNTDGQLKGSAVGGAQGNFNNYNATINVYYRHKVDHITPDHPADGYTKQDLQRVANRVIHYERADNNAELAPSTTQTVTFNGEGYYDEVTHQLVNAKADSSASTGYVLDPTNTQTPKITWTIENTKDATNGSFNEHTPTNPIVINNGDNQGTWDTDTKVVPSAKAVRPDASDTPSVDNVYVLYHKENTPTPPAKQQGTVIVGFYDDTTDTPISGVGYNSGKQDEGTAVSYNPSTDQQKLINEGYVYVRTDGTLPTTVPVGTTTVTIHMKHGQQPVDPTHPGTPQTPNKPGTPQHPTDYKPSDLTKNVTRTIHYIIDGDAQDKPTAPKDVTQKVTFTQHGVYDTVTGKWITPLTWSADQTVDAVTSPKIDKYHVISVDRDGAGTNVGAVTLTHANNSYTVNVTYEPDAVPPTQEKGSITVTFHDDTTDTDLQGYGNKTGEVNSGTAYTYNPQTDLNKLIAIGYKQVGTLPTIPSQVPNTDLSYVIHVVHGTQPVDPDHPGTPQTPNKPGQPQHPTDYKPSDLTKTITRTIHYSGAGAQTPKDVTQNVTFTQSGVYDTVTGKWITPLTWSGSQTVSNVSSPKINGYHVTSVDRDSTDNTNVDSKTLTHADDSYQVNVTYDPDTPVTPTKEQGSVTINVHDDTINQDLPDYGYKTGTVDEGTAVNYANHDDQIKELTNRGYVIVSDPYADGTVVKTVPGNDNLTYTIHVKHGRQPVNPENPGTPQTPNKPGQPQHPTDYRPEDLTKTVTRTIHYVGAGNQTPKDVTQQVTFTQSGVYDTVTGKWITPLHWSDDQMVANVASPTITHYHVVSVDKDSTDNKNVDAKTLSHTTSDYVVTVTYAPDAAPVVGKGTIEVTVHDVTTNHDLPQYGKSSGSQNVGTDFTYDKTGTITDLTNHGYKVLNPDVVIPTKITEGDHSTIIYVEHSFSPVNPDHPHNGIDPKNYTDTTTETVTYRALDRNGNVDSTVKVPANNNQTVTWTRTLTIDNVTGQLVSNGQYDTGWTSTDPDFKAVTTPVLDGYYADRASVPSALSHHGDQPVTVVVTYRPNGRIIPVDQNGKQIPGTQTPEFPTNPKNPTETTTGRIPNVPNNYKPVNPGQNPGSPISPDPTNPGKDVEVPFKPQTPTPVAKDQNAVVNYIDLDNNNQQVATSGALSGKAGARIDYSTTTTLTRLEGEGYVLVNNGFDPNGEIQYYDNNDNTTQTYVVTLKHGHQTVTPDNPGNPGTPNVPGQPQHPTDYTPESLTKTVTRTIHYTGASGQTPQDVKQEVTFTQSGVYDTVTGKWITPLHWSDSQSVANVTSPTINGYHVVSVDKDSTDHQNVDSKILTHADSDYVVTVTYAKNAAPVVGKGTITVTVHDVTTGQDLPQYGKTSGSENVGSDFSYDKTGTITTLTNLGYKVLNPDIVIPTKITEGNHQSIIYVEHTTTTVTPDKPGHPGEPINPDNPNGPKYPQGTDESQVKRTGTQTIHYTGAGANTPSDNKQSFDFTRTITFDNVTGKITNTTPWNVSSHTFGDVDTPVVNGYHADKRTAGGTTITPDDLTKTVTVTYSPNGKIIPVDPSGKPIPNVPNPQYPTNPNDPTGVTPEEPVPNIPGMTPSTPTVTPAKPGEDTKVPYTPIAEQKATIHYIDSDNDNKDIVTPVTETGKSGSPINYSTKDTIKQLTDEGYVLVTNGFDPNGVAPDFDSDSKKDQSFEVVFKHGTQTINPNNPGTPGQPINPNDPNGPKWPDDSDAKHLQVEGKQTVHYVGVDPSDPNAPKDVENDVYFNHEVVIDKVTGKVIDDHGWTVSTDKAGQHLVNHGDGHEFDAIKTPVVNGYVADKRDAGQGFVTHDNPVINDTVTYKKVGKIVPVDPNGNPIPNAPTPSYHNDPTDPTRVVPDEPVPKIDGYKPNVNTVTPQDPTKDTPVIYTKPKPVTPPTPDNPTPNPPTPDNPQPNNPEPNNPQPNNPQPNNPAPAPVHGETVPGTTPTEPQPNNNQTETTKPHGENVPTKSEKSAQPKGRAILDNPIKPKGQTVPTIKNAVPTQGQTNATKTATGQAQNTLPQTGNNQQANATAAAIGGAAAALGLIGLAGVRKKRRKGEKGNN